MYQYLEPADIFDFFDKLKTFMTETISPAWEVLRWKDTREADNIIEFWASNTGFTGQDKVILGFRTYVDEAKDIYNLYIMSCTAFNSALSAGEQVNYTSVAACSFNLQHPVWLCGDARHIRWVARMAATYVTYFAGLYIPYQPQMIQPYYIALGGNNTGIATRYSDVSTLWISTAANRRVLIPRGWVNDTGGMGIIGVTGGLSIYGKRLLAPVTLYHSETGGLGQFQGVYFTTGFSAVPEDILQVEEENGNLINYLLVPELTKRGITNYTAFELR